MIILLSSISLLMCACTRSESHIAFFGARRVNGHALHIVIDGHRF